MLAHFVRALSLWAVLGCAGSELVPAQSPVAPDAEPFLESVDPVVRDAAAALASGRPWRATEILDSAYRAASARSPDATILTATAAAEWGGWSRVERELAGAPWVDSLFDGRGRELLARSALARGADSMARAHAERSVGSARTDHQRGMRLVLLARALDRLAVADSASATYTRAAGLLPSISDWLVLRAAGVAPDGAARAQYYARVRSEVARERVSHTEAQALERWGDHARAATAYAALGARGKALRLRLLAGGAEARRAIRSEAVELLGERASPSDVREAVALLDSAFAPLSREEELSAARAAARAGLLTRAAAGFQRAARARALGAEDRFTYATTLSRLGRDRDAATQFAGVPAASEMGGVAAYQRARALLRSGRGSAAVTALRQVAANFARDTAAAASALFLLSDLATDDGRDADARATFLALARRYPTSSFAPIARFRAAIIAYAAGSHRTAAIELDSLLDRYPRSVEANAAGYWAGRAWQRAGNAGRARERWRAVLDRDPLSYYSMTSARRLGEQWWAPTRASDSTVRSPAIEALIARTGLLERVGMGTEESLEYQHLAENAGRSPDSLLAAADALRARGETSRAITLARRALGASAPRDTRLFRLLYPLAYGDVIRAEARTHGIEPALAAALIHQESSFNPRATSRAGAMGLMQILPNVGQSLARSLRFPFFERVLLYQPDVNIRLGMTHLDAMLRTYPEVAYALAAYNAGGTPVRRWRTKRGADDPELFIERIPYQETRDYVRILLRNRATYEGLYDW